MNLHIGLIHSHLIQVIDRITRVLTPSIHQTLQAASSQKV
jgi:hypothetical protein